MTDSELIETKYVPITEAIQWLWKDNPKKHDIGAIIQSIERYGFQDPPKFNKGLESANGSEGALSYGNGRVEALYKMYIDGNYELPKGVYVDGENVWCVPVEFGVDLSPNAAKAFAIDHNNLTMSGGDFTGDDMALMWGPEYLDIVTELAEVDFVPVSIDLDWLGVKEKYNKGPDEFPEYDEDIATEYCCPKCGYEWSGKPK